MGLIAAVMHLEKPFDQKLFIPETGGCFLITGKNCPSQTEHNDLEHRSGKKLTNFIIVIWSNSAKLGCTGESELRLPFSHGEGKAVRDN